MTQITISNWCKFSICREKNIDYAGDREKREASLPYVKAELAILRPSVVVLPHRILSHGPTREAMCSVVPDAKFIGLPQYSPMVINCHLRNMHTKGQALMAREQGSPMAVWAGEIKKLHDGFFWRYLAKAADQIS